MARSQGFPDYIEFLLEPNSRSIKSITKQIGNAVPIPMAAAIGREIVKAYQLTHQKEREERESSVAL
jgi:DNA (cytosine-5)-methyltransferase 1